MMDGHMTIKRPEVELDPGIVNKSFEFESRRSENLDFDLPERDYEVTGNSLTCVRCDYVHQRDSINDGPWHILSPLFYIIPSGKFFKLTSLIEIIQKSNRLKVNGMTDIDIMMEDEFNELERDYPRPHY